MTTSIITQTIKSFCITLIVSMMGTTAMAVKTSSITSANSDVLPVVEETITVSQNSRLPQHDGNGDYRRSPHKIWKVVDRDPNGLNCRMSDMTYRELITFHSITNRFIHLPTPKRKPISP